MLIIIDVCCCAFICRAVKSDRTPMSYMVSFIFGWDRIQHRTNRAMLPTKSLNLTITWRTLHASIVKRKSTRVQDLCHISKMELCKRHCCCRSNRLAFSKANLLIIAFLFLFPFFLISSFCNRHWRHGISNPISVCTRIMRNSNQMRNYFK